MSPFTTSLATCHPERSGMPAKRVSRVVEGRLHFIRSLWERMVAARKLAVAALREIFDESAYERFLEQHQLSSSAAAYSSFCHERDHSRARRPRCC